MRAQSLLAVAALAAAQAAAQSSDQSNYSTPFPASTYPGAEDPSIDAGALFLQQSPPFYPSPWMDGSGDWASAYTKAQAFVRQLTLLEKVNLTTGSGWGMGPCVGMTSDIPRLSFSALCMQDSPLGIRFADLVSAFPAGGTVAASFDRGLWYQRGYDMGSEHRGKGVDAQLGPVVGPLGRAPEGGRNWEGFSPDPVLSGIAVAQTVKGIQAAGVIATTKHFILNEQEHFRQVNEARGFGFNLTGSISSNLNDITMHELYLWPFADAVRAGTGYTMNYLLKGELGFQGFVMSDWQAQGAGVQSAISGLDMAMPGDTLFDTGVAYWGANLTLAVVNGTLPEWRLDDMATRIMAAYYYVGRDKARVPVNFHSWTQNTFGYNWAFVGQGYQLVNQHVNVRDAHGRTIRDHAARSTVLLKNVRGTLPLKGTEVLTAVFGDDAGDNRLGPNGCPNRGCLNGTLAMGWGSGTAEFPYLVTPLTAIQNEVLSRSTLAGVEDVLDNWAYSDIASLAARATVAIVFVNADSGEAFISIDHNDGDRQNLTFWKNGDSLIQNVTALCNNTVVVIHSVGPVLLTNVANNPNVTAIIWAGLPGQESGNSLADILYGRVNPGAKLPFTLGASRQDYGTDLLYRPNNGGDAPQQDFTEGVFIDYRHFDRANVTPIYEFGFGLSYTTFAYSNISVEKHSVGQYAPTTGMTKAAPVLGNYSTNYADYLFPANINRVPLYIYPYLNSSDPVAAANYSGYGQQYSWPAGATNGSPQRRIAAGGAPGGNPELYDVMFTVRATITNTGTIPGEEVPQLYLNLGGPNDPKVVLRNFERLSIQPRQSTTFVADVTRRDLSNWDPVSQNWVITTYPKTAYVGSSSRKLLLTCSIPL